MVRWLITDLDNPFWLTTEQKMTFQHVDNFKMVKSFGQCQPAHTVQANTGQYFFQLHLGPLITENGSF